jgi:hypothetical protein
MRFYDGRFLIHDSSNGFRADELSVEALNGLGGPEAVKLRMHETARMVLPFMVNKPLVANDQVTLANWVFKVVSDRASAEASLRSVIAQKNFPITEEEISAMLEIPVNCEDQKNNSVPKDFLKFAAGDSEALRALKHRVIEDDIQYKHANKTMIQQSNTDKVSVRLPDADVLFTHELGSAYPSTYAEIPFNPYPNPLYRIKHIINILKAGSASERAAQIRNVVSILKNTYYVTISDADAKKLEVNFELLPYEHVFGHKENDTIPILDNERDFYENLVDFIKWHIYAFNKEIMTRADEAEIQDKSDKDFANGVIPLRLQEYLNTLLYNTLDKQFGHTGNFNIEKDLFDEDDEKDSESDSAEDDHKVMVTKRDPKSSDLDVLAANYLALSAKQFSAAVWAEGIIKLMRWGDRKVENLYVGENNTQYFDIASMELITTQTADLSNFEPEIDSEGRSISSLGLAFCEFKPRGESRRRAYPFVFVGYEVGSLPGVEEKVQPVSLLTLFDIVRSYTTGTPLIQGLDFDGGVFSTDYSEDLSMFTLADVAKKPVRVIEELTDFAIDNNISKITGLAGCLLNPEDLKEYMDNSPLVDRLGATPKQLRNMVVQGALLDVFQEGAQDSNIRDLAELLNWYHSEIYPVHLSEYCTLFGYETQSQGQQAAPKLSAKNLATANFFGVGGQSEEPQEEKREEEQFMYNIYDGSDALVFNKIMHTIGGVPTPVGAFAVIQQDGKEAFVFAGISEISGFAASAAEKPVGQLITRLWEVCLCADQKQNLTTRTMVLSPLSIGSIYKSLSGMQ